MFNIRKLMILATSLTIIGVAGSLATYQFLEKPETLTEEIAQNDFTNIEIQATDGNVTISPTTEQTAWLEITGYRLNEQFSSTLNDEKLSIVYQEKSKKFFNFGAGQKSVEINMYLPEKNYHSIQAEAKNGKIKLTGLTINEMNLNANNGALYLDNSQSNHVEMNAKNGKIIVNDMISKTLKLQADNGRIELNQATIDTANFSSKNGKIKLTEVTGALSAKVHNGSILLTTQKLESPIDFIANNGKIKIESIQEPTNVEIKAQAQNGKTTIFNKKTTFAQFGSGDNKINLQADNGKIIVSE